MHIFFPMQDYEQLDKHMRPKDNCPKCYMNIVTYTH